MVQALVCNNVQKKFDDFSALKGVSLSVEPGECFGLLGPNGAGKSTLISLIYGAGSITAGDITVFGKNPMVDGRKIRAELGVVTQDNNLDTSMTVEENMLMFARFVGLPRDQHKKRIDELLDYMMLSHKKDAVIESLSGGMQRRLVFVRALLNSPKIVILDEPTTGLDPAVRQLLWDKVQDLKSSGATIILTTHYMDEAERLCDRLVIMNEGEIQAQGTPKELIEKYYPGYVAVVDDVQGVLSASQGIVVTQERGQWVLRSDQLQTLVDYIAKHQIKPLTIRPTNLEDVFLQVTGRDLAHND